MKNNNDPSFLPTVALLLEGAPFVLPFLGVNGGMLLLLILLCPIGGLVMGVSSLRKGKKALGAMGLVLTILAILFPIAFLGFVIFSFVGIATGLIPLM